MGYQEIWRSKMLKDAMVGYTRVLQKVAQGETQRNRKGVCTLLSRRFKRLVGPNELFRLDQDTDAVELTPP